MVRVLEAVRRAWLGIESSLLRRPEATDPKAESTSLENKWVSSGLA